MINSSEKCKRCLNEHTCRTFLRQPLPKNPEFIQILASQCEESLWQEDWGSCRHSWFVMWWMSKSQKLNKLVENDLKYSPSRKTFNYLSWKLKLSLCFFAFKRLQLNCLKYFQCFTKMLLQFKNFAVHVQKLEIRFGGLREEIKIQRIK